MAGSKRSHEGYLLIENRFAPGISAEEAAKTGKEVIGAGLRGRFEAGVLTCSHCQRQVIVNPLRTRDRNWCPKCDHYICDSPGCLVGCNPYKARLDRAQAKQVRDLALQNQSPFTLRKKPKKPTIIIP